MRRKGIRPGKVVIKLSVAEVFLPEEGTCDRWRQDRFAAPSRLAQLPQGSGYKFGKMRGTAKRG